MQLCYQERVVKKEEYASEYDIMYPGHKQEWLNLQYHVSILNVVRHICVL